MSCGMFLHDWAPPRPPIPAFTRQIPTKFDNPDSPPILLYFYVPDDYSTRIKQGHRYPVVINFHGGGFCLGNATDDRYWANVVLRTAKAVFVSVDYRRAPEFPYPTAVDDSVDAVLYLSCHAAELGLDTSRVALSGFSAGANLAFTVPFRLTFHTKKGLMSTEDLNLARWPSTQKMMEEAPDLKIVNIVAFYPLLDWSLSRNSKRRTSRKPEKTLPKFFSDLFDFSYLPPPDTMLHASPFVSPGLAPDNMLTEGLPNDIQIFLCEWDMLLKEGEIFACRLRRLGKNVRETLIPGVVHGWDKHPDPWRDQAAIDALYEKACEGLRETFGIGAEPQQESDEDK
jgi:putative ergosteryl-3beta-O-L-aspartate hydrolase